eukprot:gene15437-4633_t
MPNLFRWVAMLLTAVIVHNAAHAEAACHGISCRDPSINFPAALNAHRETASFETWWYLGTVRDTTTGRKFGVQTEAIRLNVNCNQT